MNMADFDGTGLGSDTKIARYTGRPAAAPLDNRKEQRITALPVLAHPVTVGLHRCKRAISHIGPASVVRVQGIGGEQRIGMDFGGERLQATEPPVDRLARRRRRRPPVWQWLTDGLTELIDKLCHGSFRLLHSVQWPTQPPRTAIIRLLSA